MGHIAEAIGPIVRTGLGEPIGKRITPADAGVEIPLAPDVKAPRIPERFKNASFTGFRRDDPAQREGLEAAVAWTVDVRADKPQMLALIGPPGVGKSHLLYAAARHLYKSGKLVYCNPWYKLADELRWGRGGPNLYESRDIVAELYGQKIVMIDEVRPTANTAFDDTALAKFACHAYDNNVSVLITSNVNPLDLVMGPAAADRFQRVVINTGSKR